MKDNPILYIVVPCYNEEAVLPTTSQMFLDKVNSLIEKNIVSNESRIMFVNDGSKDSTWEIIKKLSTENEHFIGISQSRNRGHQNSLLAGLMEAKSMCDITVSLDADGQDDIDAIDEMIEKYKEGYEIVYGARNSRKKDSFFKRFTAQTFYRLLNCMGVECIYNSADYRLISSRVLNEFENFKEVNLFLRGMFPLVGFKSTIVYYERHERIAGKSHYPLSKMLGLAVDGITSLSIRPIRIITFFGFLLGIAAFAGIIWVFISALSGGTVSGWASTLCAICLMGGIQLISLGVIGEYVGKIYLETKARPRYIISERTYEEHNN